MRFYNRTNELEEINLILNRKDSDLVYISWRRRIWKTKLILKSLENCKFLYFFVWEKTKWELLNDFTQIIEKNLWVKYLNFLNLKDFFDFLFNYAKKEKLVLVFDEFQNFFNIDKKIFSDLQYLWDLNKDEINIKLFCLWSHFTLMKKIFDDYSSPLYWRKTANFHLKSFDLNTQIKILQDYKILNEKNLLHIFSIFYWIPKYLDIFFKNFNQERNFFDEILDIFFKENSFFLNEWKELFALEFWKSYEIYSSILSAIAVWKTKKSEISHFTWISNDSLWIYIKKLETYYELIERNIPITEKKSSKNSKYKIKDLFLKFWFSFSYKYNYLIEMWDSEELKKIVKNNIDSFLWFSFEELVKQIIIQENKLSQMPFKIEKIWSFFDKKWQNEIDLVCVNSKEKKVLFVECKLNSKKFSLDNLREKVKKSWIYFSYKKFYWSASLDLSNNNIDWKIWLNQYLKNNLNSIAK